MERLLGLVPIRNFAHIIDNIYRSAQPLATYEYKWLSEVVGIDIIVNLRAELDHDKQFINEFNFECHTYSVKDHEPPTIEQANGFINLIKDINITSNVLIHCEHGHGRTSTFSVLAKIAKGVTVEDAIADEKSRFHYHFKHHLQEKFLLDNFSKVTV